ncbi:hypothetical protein EW026_g6712 [Hermanssonia centrifuga]|uniref:Uncharacterized protein n=1 Tax=Hermanssonia centrifuga TaxID=98765 RepID=A0A4S4KA65_9APHY|nr:hypothetical protein EW026_g6712 [Hermanssonia centrifuga]
MIEETLKGRKPHGFDGTDIRKINPFWATVPHCDIFQCMTPDILHQLHKGVFKDRIVKWATKCMEGRDNEVDQRFRAMIAHSKLKYFRKGISLVSQWTGTEYKNMEKVFLGVIGGGADAEVVQVVRAALDFIYYAHFKTHSEESLAQMDRTADGYSTESPERLHIDFAKLGYRASNKKQYVGQMTTWLERREAITRFEAYLDWINGTGLAQKDKGNVEEDVDEQEGQDSGEPDVEEEEEDGESTKFVYCIAKCPVFPQTPIDSLVNDFGAADFHLHLETFLRSRTDRPSKPLSPTLTQRTRFGVFKQAKLKLPAMSQVSRSSENNTIHASPGKPAQGIQPAKYGRFSSVMAQEFLNDGGHGRDDKNPLEGLRVARVRAIFELPIEYAHLSNKPLTYVEWFTPFNVRDTDLDIQIL